MTEAFLGEKLHESVNIIEEAVKEHHPLAVFASFSGGRDSVVVTDLFFRWVTRHPISAKIGVFAIKTGFQADQWDRWIEEYCSKKEWPLEFGEGYGREWYKQQVLQYGYPYARSHHVNIYRYLKQAAIERHVKATKLHRMDRVMYVTGVRRDESSKRKKTQHEYRKGARVGVNPLVNWTDSDVDLYIKTLIPDYDNPFYSLYGSSGDCYCGWTCTHTVDQFREESPDLARFLDELNVLSTRRGLWCYGERPTGDVKALVAAASNEEMPEDALCINCSHKMTKEG